MESQLNTSSSDIKDRDSKLKTAPLCLSSMFSNFIPDKPHEKPEILKESFPSHTFPENNNAMTRGPPSLNAWVLEQGSNIALPPMAPRFSPGIPWPHDRVSDVATSYISSPRLIDDPVTTNASGTLSPAAPTSPKSPGRHQPLSGMLTSSEWLRQYREKHGLKQHPQTTPANLPARSYTPPRTYTNSPDATAIELYDRWGNPVASVPKMNLPVPQPFSDLGKGHLLEKHAPKAYGFVNEVEEYLKERDLDNAAEATLEI